MYTIAPADAPIRGWVGGGGGDGRGEQPSTGTFFPHCLRVETLRVPSKERPTTRSRPISGQLQPHRRDFAQHILRSTSTKKSFGDVFAKSLKLLRGILKAGLSEMHVYIRLCVR